MEPCQELADINSPMAEDAGPDSSFSSQLLELLGQCRSAVHCSRDEWLLFGGGLWASCVHPAGKLGGRAPPHKG